MIHKIGLKYYEISLLTRDVETELEAIERLKEEIERHEKSINSKQ